MADLMLYVPTISCRHCKSTIETAVSAVPGVKQTKVLVDNRIVEVDFSGKPQTEAVIAAIEKTHKVETHTG